MGRAPCCDKASVKKGPWSPEEDAALKNYLEKNGTGGNWISLPHKAGLKRCGKSCRLRWLNYLRPDIKRGGFTQEEDMIIWTLYGSIGSRWSVIASQLPGRTDNDIKNYWNTRLKKKMLAGSACPMAATSNNRNETPKSITHLNLGEISASIPKLEPYDCGNSACFDTSSSTLSYPLMVNAITAQNSESDGLISIPIQSPTSKAMQVSDYRRSGSYSITSSQDVSGPTTSSTFGLGNSSSPWSANEGFKEEGLLLDFGFESHGDELLNGFEFQEGTRDLAPFWATPLKVTSLDNQF